MYHKRYELSDNMILKIDGMEYPVCIRKTTANTKDSIKILIPTYLLSDEGLNIAQLCLESIRRNTTSPHEIWVIDNNSPEKYFDKLLDIDGINIVRNNREPLNNRRLSSFKKALGFIGISNKFTQLTDGSYANAIALEIGIRMINSSTPYVFAMHSDTMAVKPGWLQYLCSKIDDKTRAVGCVSDNIRINALHISGLLFDYQLYKKLGLTMLPNLDQLVSKQLPEYDVGDSVTLFFQKQGYSIYRCSNTHNTPELSSWIEDGSVYDIHVDRSFDDSREVIFLHLGRGTPKSVNDYRKEGRVMADEWIALGRRLLSSPQ